jgi:hypothetical protein
MHEKVGRTTPGTWVPNLPMLKLLLCLFCALPILASLQNVAAQSRCDVAEALNEAERQGCLLKEQRPKLAGWLANLPQKEAGEALRMAADCYQCLQRKKVDAQKFSCFREILQDRLYAKLPADQLCLRDRLIRALIPLRRLAAQAKVAPADAGALDAALNEFISAFAACRNVHQNPTLDTSIGLAQDWCLDANSPAPPFEFTQEFIEALVGIAAQNPDQGRHLGAVLGAILRDAKTLGLDDQAAREVDKAYQTLIEQDRESLAGTSHIYIFKQELSGRIPEPDWPRTEQIQALLASSKDLQKRLDTGADRLQYRATAWKPYEEYSDVLQKLADGLRFQNPQRKTREQLAQLACQALRRGIEVSEGSEAQEMVRIQEKLLDRVRNFGFELGLAKRYYDVIEFESGFLDPSSKTLSESQQCYLHAHLAQAFYAVGDNRKAMEHFGKSCGKITIEDLKKLKDKFSNPAGTIELP